MSKKYSRVIGLTVFSILLASPTLAQDLASIKKNCDTQHPNAAYHACKTQQKCGDNKSCKAACNERPEVQTINKLYDACVSAALAGKK